VTEGYSGTPLAKKLSLKDGMRVWQEGMPQTVIDEILSERLELHHLSAPKAPIDGAHIFVKDRATLEAKLHDLMPKLAPSGFIWVSWPKKGSKVPTDITEDTIREVCLPMGLVDVKVCAIDATWSGLKLMQRRT
jgi:hypothetical protein